MPYEKVRNISDKINLVSGFQYISIINIKEISSDDYVIPVKYNSETVMHNLNALGRWNYFPLHPQGLWQTFIYFCFACVSQVRDFALGI